MNYHSHHTAEKTPPHTPGGGGNHSFCNHSGHSHSIDFKEDQKLYLFLLALSFGYFLVESIAAYFTGSLALAADSFHMLSDSAAIVVAWAAVWMASKSASSKYSYGHGKFETLGAFVNSISLVALLIFLFAHAVFRLGQPVVINSVAAAVVSGVGMVVNILMLYIMHKKAKHNLNNQATKAHIIADLLFSVLAVIANIGVYFTNYNQIDSIVTILGCVIMLRPAFRLILESAKILLDSVPQKYNFNLIGLEILKTQGVKGLHDLHIWMIDASTAGLSAHVVIEDMGQWEQVREGIERLLHQQFQIDHITLQPESTN